MSVYTVQAGDTLESIAKLFLVSVTDLQKWNNGKFPSLYSTTLPMTPGWVINVSPPSRTTYNVTDFGAIGHDITRNDGSVIASSTTFVSKDGTFKSGDVGTNITVDYAATNTTLSDMLIQGASYSLLTVNPLTTEIASGANVVVQFGTYTQTFVAAATAPVGAIYVTITAQVANYSYPIGSYVDPANLTTTITSVSSPTLITLGDDATITAFGLSYTYTPDDTAAIQAAIDACAVEGGMVQIPPGSYQCNGAVTPAQSEGYIKIVGSGIYNTTLIASQNVNTVLNQMMPGEITDLTVDGGAIAVNGLAQTTSGTIAITQMAARRVRTRNISTTGGGWVHIVWDEAQLYQIDRYYLEDVIWEGPSDPNHDAAAISYINNIYVNNLRCKSLSRTPNINAANNLVLDGLIADQAGYACFVVDAQVSIAKLNNIIVESGAYGLFINSPNCTISNCSTSSITSYANSGWILQMNNVSISSEGPILGFNNPGSMLIIDSCSISETNNAAIYDRSVSGSVTDTILVNNSYINIGPQSLLYSYNGTTVTTFAMTNSQYIGSSNVFQNITVTHPKLTNNPNYNPTGPQSAPTMPSSGTSLTNPFPFDATIYVSGGTVTEIAVGGTSTGLTSGAVFIPAGETITLTYSSAPTWVWIGN